MSLTQEQRQQLATNLKPLVKKAKTVKVKEPEGKTYIGCYDYNLNIEVYFELFEVERNNPLTVLNEEIIRYAVACKKLGIEA